jgi:hypothetical protein
MKIKTVVAVFFAICCAAQTGLAQGSAVPRPQRPAPPRSGQPAFMMKLKAFDETPFATKAVMKNGLTVIVHEFHAFPVASLTSYVRAGIAYENAENAGVSEAMARLFFGVLPAGQELSWGRKSRRWAGLPSVKLLMI